MDAGGDTIDDNTWINSSVVDPHKYFSDPDPDPAFHFYVDPDPDPDPGFLLTKLQFFL